METTHSKNRRAKKPASQIVVNEWDDVWRSFNEANKKITIESMEADGWRLATIVAQEIGVSRQAVFDMVNTNKMEKTSRKIFYSGKTREMTFVRPRLTTCQ